MIKPSVVFILILCIAGYNFLSKIPEYNLKLQRSNGYHTFLLSAGGGLLLFAVSCVLYVICFKLANFVGVYPSLGKYLLLDIFLCDATKAEIALFDISSFSLLFSFLIPRYYWGNKTERRMRQLVHFSGDSESPEFTQLFFRSLRFGVPILFTMSDRKVYIGYITEVHATKFNDVIILPIFSGYRTKDELRLVPVTPYQAVLDDIENEAEKEIDFDIFAVALPLREIVYAHLHDFKYYEKFKEKENEFNTLNQATKFTYKNTLVN